METVGRGENKHGSEKCSSNQPGKDTGNQTPLLVRQNKLGQIRYCLLLTI